MQTTRAGTAFPTTIRTPLKRNIKSPEVDLIERRLQDADREDEAGLVEELMLARSNEFPTGFQIKAKP